MRPSVFQSVSRAKSSTSGPSCRPRTRDRRREAGRDQNPEDRRHDRPLASTQAAEFGLGRRRRLARSAATQARVRSGAHMRADCFSRALPADITSRAGDESLVDTWALRAEALLGYQKTSASDVCTTGPGSTRVAERFTPPGRPADRRVSCLEASTNHRPKSSARAPGTGDRPL